MNSTTPMPCRVSASATRLGDLPARRMVLPLLLALCSLGAWLWPADAMAGNCWITSAPRYIAFGNIDSGGAATTATLGFVCDNYTGGTVSHRVCLYVNPSRPSGVAPRRMELWYPQSFLNYDLYADPAHSQVLGSESSGHPVYSTVLTMTSNGQATGSFPVYARLPPGQTVIAGNYISQNDMKLHFADQAGSTPPTDAECAVGKQSGTQYTEVTAQYANACYISTATDLDFGSAADLTQTRDQTSRVSLHCPAGTAWRVALDDGSHPSAGVRRMAGPGGHIDYQLYRDGGRSQVWSTAPSDVSGTGDNSIQDLTIYGRVPAQGNVAPGDYSDTITVTLTY